MTNHEKYRKTFGQVQSSKTIRMEDLEMKKTSYLRNKVASVACAAVILLAGTGGVVYAANIGGIRETMHLWFHGKQVESTIEETGAGSYSITYQDADGEHEIGGGGVSMDADGTERPISMEEYVEHMNTMPDVDVDENGRVWLYAQGTSIDITDEFENGKYQTVLTIAGKQTWITVTPNGDGGYGISASTDGPIDD